MVRFNLLLIGNETSVHRKVKRVLSVFFRKSYVFTAENQLEAHKLMSKLHIDLVMVDFDEMGINARDMKDLFPNVKIVGVTKDNATMIKMAPQPIKVMHRKGFTSQLASLFKEMKKGKRVMPQGATVNQDLLNFEDFSVLMPN